jgi:hypothetical protein
MVVALKTKDTRPTFFTIVNGGDWHPWPEWLPGPTTSDLAQRDGSALRQVLFRIAKRPFTIVFYVHSVQFPDGSEWDCYNGWR